MNEALIMKLLWKFASGNSALWVGIARAKYLPRSELWIAKRTYNCTSCWRAIMAARESLFPKLIWSLGDGRKCSALMQPWFEGAVINYEHSAAERKLCVRDLVVEETGTWNVDLLIQFYGHQNCLYILTNVKPPREGACEDRLIFSDSTTGVFSVKKVFKHISQINLGVQGNLVWKLIWRKGSIWPRIRIFLWKLMHGALPLAKIIATRTSRGEPTCAVCNQGDEGVVHILFWCPFARACWLLVPLALRTEGLPHDISSIFAWSYENSSEEAWTAMANTTWAIWRCRNEVYGG